MKEAKASVKGNLLWRAIALNQQEGLAEVDAALQTAISHTTPLTLAAWNVAMSNLKNLQRLADPYKKAQGVYDGNLKAGSTAGSSAFGVRLKPISTRGVDRIVITAGDAIFRAFRIDKAGRKLPFQVDSSEVETSWLKTLGLNTAGGTLPRESCGRYSL